MSETVCGHRYGSRRQFVCQRPAGHKGLHALRKRVWEFVR